MTRGQLPIIPIAAAAAVAVLLEGRSSPPAEALFIALAGAALVTALIVDDEAAGVVLSKLPVAALVLLGLLSVASAAWTIVPPKESLDQGLVVAAFAALAVSAGAVATQPGGVRALAVVVIAVATTASAIGLVAVALRDRPSAEWLAQTWRPAGPMGYPPALALLEVSALPGLLLAMSRSRLRLAVPAAAAAAVAGGVLATAESRLELALALTLMALFVALSWRNAVDRRIAIAASAVVAVGGVAFTFAGDVRAGLGETEEDAPRLVAMAAIVAAAAAGWWLLRRSLARGEGREPPRLLGRRSIVAAVVALAIAITVSLVQVLDEPEGQGATGYGGLTHGRLQLWGDAAETVAERPLLGAGADSFAVASIEEQQGEPIRYAHNLPLQMAAELGLAGLLAVLALYVGSAWALWRARQTEAAWLLGPGAAAFLIASLIDWPWHLAGSGAIWAICLGGVVAAATCPRKQI